MATDATGTPSANRNYPKYLTSADAPSGVGLNNIVDAIDQDVQNLADNAVSVSGSPVEGDALVWDATTSSWKPASSQPMAVGGLEAGTDGQVLVTNGSTVEWGTSASTGFGTSLPGSPADGDQFVLTDSLTAPTYQWLLQYVAAKASNKWIFLGGAPYKAASGGQATSNTSYSGPFGPSLTIPVTGLYTVSIGGHVVLTGGAGLAHASYSIGGTAANDVWGVGVYFGSASAMASRTYFHGSIAGGTALTTYVRSPNGASYGTWSEIALSLVPTAVGG